MDVLERALSYDEVTEIFVRVFARRQASKLGPSVGPDHPKVAEFSSDFPEISGDCAKVGFDLDLGLHLRNLMAFATRQSRFRAVGGLSVQALQEAWKDAGEGMQFAMNFLKSNPGIESPALLSSPFIMVAIAYFGHVRRYKIAPEEADALRYWALVANAKGRFSRGSSETLLDQDLATLRDGGRVRDLIDRLRLQVGKLDVSPEELEGRNQRSALFKTMFLVFRAAGAKDWRSNLNISLDHSGAHHRYFTTYFRRLSLGTAIRHERPTI